MDAKTILEAVNNIEQRRSRYINMAKASVDLFNGKFWTQENYKEAEKEGRVLVTSLLPRNIVSLAMRMIASQPDIVCSAEDASEESQFNARARERFLKALFRAQSVGQPINVVQACKFNALVKGRAALKVLWVKDHIPKTLQSSVPAIKIAALDPLSVGVAYGEYYPSFAYHKMRKPVYAVRQRFPDSTVWNERAWKDFDEVEILDAWWVDEDGAVWQAVHLLGGGGLNSADMVIKPTKTKYPMLPILERWNDPTPLEKEEEASVGILTYLREHIANQNALMSLAATAVANYLWPAVHVTNEYGHEIGDIDRHFGAINELPPGTKFIGVPNDAPQMNLLGVFKEMIEGEVQQNTFAPELYGMAPQNRQAGYGLALLFEAAQGRIKDTVFELERLFEDACKIALFCVEKFAGKRGVSLYAYDEREQKMYQAALTPDQIRGEYGCTINMANKLPTDRMQLSAIGLQMLQAGVLSKRTVRKQYVPFDAPEDEELQVLIEQIENDPDLKRAVIREAAALRGIYLPEGEPDWTKTPQAQQPPEIFPQAPDLMGQMTPEALAQPQLTPSQFDMMQGALPSPEMLAFEEMLRGGLAGGEDLRPRP